MSLSPQATGGREEQISPWETPLTEEIKTRKQELVCEVIRGSESFRCLFEAFRALASAPKNLYNCDSNGKSHTSALLLMVYTLR